MATQKTTVAAHTEPAPIEPTATGPITLPEMPPAETFQGLITYAVDTATNQSKQLPLDFLADGVAACIDATADAIEQTKATVAATEKATASATGADEAASAARTEAANLSALKTAVVNATADAIEKTQAAETAATNADTATTVAKAATADAVEKTKAAQTAATEANAAKDAAIEATENLTGDVSALVLTPANKPRIQELSGIDYSILEEQIVPGEFWYVNGKKKQVYTRTFVGTTPATWSGIEVPIVDSPQGLTSLVYVSGYVGTALAPHWSLAGGIMEWTYRFAANLIHLGVPNGSTTYLKGVPYALTFKYTY